MKSLGNNSCGTKWWVISVLIHIVGLTALFFLSRYQQGGMQALWTGETEEQMELETEKAQAAAGALVEEQEIRPFQGISYGKYLHLKKVAKQKGAKKKANALLAKLGVMKLDSGSGGGGQSSDLKSAGEGVEKIRVSGGSRKGRLTKRIKRQKFTFRSSSINSGARKMSNKERSELRKNFKRLERKFRRVYARALQKDPHLSLTVSFEAEIRTSGYLRVSKFRARGKYQPESLSLMKENMSKLIAQVFVASDLAGTLIRGESVFIK